MKKKVFDLMMVSQALGMVVGREFPATVAFWLARLEIKISSTKQAFEKTRLSLFEKFGEKTGEGPGAIWNVKPEHIEEYTKEIEAIGGVEETIDITPIKISLLEGHNLSKDFFVLIGDLIIE